jgi:hypothetical protein
MKGTKCKLGVLSQVAYKSGGMVNIIDPLDIENEIMSILEDKTIATNIIVKVILRKGIFFKDCLGQKENEFIKIIGNATIETEISFEFGFDES